MTAKSKSKSKSKRHPRGFWRSAGFGALSFCESATPTNNRFPTTTFGNDGYFALGVIPEEFCRGSRSFAREQVRRTTDPGLRLPRMTATTNNRFPTTTFGNDNNRKSHPRGFWRPADSRALSLLHFFRLKLP